MFCPKCGRADQVPDTYCRQCGMLLADFVKPGKKTISPQDHLKANSILELMTAVASLTLAIMLYGFFLGRENTPIIIYVTGGFLIAICGWQIQTFWRTVLLKKHFKRSANPHLEIIDSEPSVQLNEKPVQTNKLLERADLENLVPASVVDETTKQLIGNPVRKSKDQKAKCNSSLNDLIRKVLA